MEDHHKEKEIILLASKPNTGKTTSIVKLYKRICCLEGKEPNISQTERRNEDIRDNIAIDCNNIIGFASAGDKENEVRGNCCYFDENRCNICITACLTSGPTREVLYGWAQEHRYGISIFDFVPAVHGHEEANDEKARMMLDRLKFLIPERAASWRRCSDT